MRKLLLSLVAASVAFTSAQAKLTQEQKNEAISDGDMYAGMFGSYPNFLAEQLVKKSLATVASSDSIRTADDIREFIRIGWDEYGKQKAVLKEAMLLPLQDGSGK
jgi:hypothetical protein